MDVPASSPWKGIRSKVGRNVKKAWSALPVSILATITLMISPVGADAPQVDQASEIRAKEYDVMVAQRSSSNRTYLFDVPHDELPKTGKLVLLRIKREPVMALRVLQTYPDLNQFAAKRVRKYPNYRYLDLGSSFLAVEKFDDGNTAEPASSPSIEDKTDLKEFDSAQAQESGAALTIPVATAAVALPLPLPPEPPAAAPPPAPSAELPLTAPIPMPDAPPLPPEPEAVPSSVPIAAVSPAPKERPLPTPPEEFAATEPVIPAPLPSASPLPMSALNDGAEELPPPPSANAGAPATALADAEKLDELPEPPSSVAKSDDLPEPPRNAVDADELPEPPGSRVASNSDDLPEPPKNVDANSLTLEERKEDSEAQRDPAELANEDDPELKALTVEEVTLLDTYNNWFSAQFGYFRNGNISGGSSYSSGAGFRYGYSVKHNLFLKGKKAQDSLVIEGGIFFYKTINFASFNDAYSLIPLVGTVRYNIFLNESIGTFVYAGLMVNRVVGNSQGTQAGVDALSSIIPAAGAGLIFHMGPSWDLRADFGVDIISAGLMLRF